MGRHHTAVIVDPGKVFTFGRNIEGQLGIDGTKPANAPVEVKSISENNINVSFVEVESLYRTMCCYYTAKKFLVI